jgi:hypothetical protein
VKLPKIHLTPAETTELKRDLVVFAGALLSTGILDGGRPTLAAAVAAIVTALKVTARKVFPHQAPVA